MKKYIITIIYIICSSIAFSIYSMEEERRPITQSLYLRAYPKIPDILKSLKEQAI